MTTKVFITGVTGYVGGTLLADLTSTQSSLDITVLVRNTTQAAKINEVHPTVTTVIGDFSSHSLLVSTASASDIVLHIAGDFDSGIFSLLSGLASSTRPPYNKGILIHISGTGNLVGPHAPKDGSNTGKQYSDVDDYYEIMKFGEDRSHVALERKIIKKGIEEGVRTVILTPGYIYGNGKGTGSRSTYSFQYARDVLKRGRGFLLGKGENLWSGCSVGDVSSAIIFVLNETIKELQERGRGKIEYGWAGFYFIEDGECSMKERAEIVLRELKAGGVIETEEIDVLTEEEAQEVNPYGGMFYGSTSRSKADRLRGLGWVAKDDWREKVREATRMDLESFKKTGGWEKSPEVLRGSMQKTVQV